MPGNFPWRTFERYRMISEFLLQRKKAIVSWDLLLYLSNDYEPLLFFFSSFSFFLACLLSSRSVFDCTTLIVSLWSSTSFSSSSSFPLLPPLISLGMKGLVCEFWRSIKYLSYLLSKRTSRSPFSNFGHRTCTSFSYVKWLLFKLTFLSFFLVWNSNFLTKAHCDLNFEIWWFDFILSIMFRFCLFCLSSF